MRRFLAISAFVVAVLAGASYFYKERDGFYFLRPSYVALSPSPVIVPPSPERAVSAYYRTGFIPRELPQELLPRSAYASVNSKRISYPSGTVQAAASYRIPWSIEKLRNFYATVFREQRWTFKDGAGSVFALRGRESVYVSYSTDASGGLRVTLVYTRQILR